MILLKIQSLQKKASVDSEAETVVDENEPSI
jgi:hypothetical protein